MLYDTHTHSYTFDSRYQVFSYLKYLEDCESKCFDKICMTEVINADMSIASFGEERYVQSCREVLKKVNDTLKSLSLDELIFVYIFNYKNFIVATNDLISEKDFINLMHAFHNEYELSTSLHTRLNGVSRFVLVLEQDNMVDRAKSTLFVNKKSQDTFIIATDEKEQMLKETSKNIKNFDLINYAINNDRIVPFYQGIVKNNTGNFEKYEALMRIYDKDGKLYSPAAFLESAKKLKLYLPLSKIMLEKAMKDFKNKSSEVCLNISLFDIQSEEFKEWFINKIKKYPNPSRITVEFVETENYNNTNQLIDFLTEVRNIGCKIAIDDFGVGFATYTSIISLKPDIIKIDGDIIKNLLTTPENSIILDSICYMADLINSQTVSEFVENSAIQDIIMQNNIDYSQGYHFAKPMPMSELNVH